MAKRSAFQCKITLQDVRQPVWRRIQISDKCTFWDLHVAIQDAMGWTDSHLHSFDVVNPATSKKERIGIPGDEDDESDDHPILAGWEIKVKDYIKPKANRKISYLYDFGDSWNHLIEFENNHDEHEKKSAKYPMCLAGERACPPEDMGGVLGYENFLLIIKDPSHKEHKEFLAWVGGKFDPEKFDPRKIKFNNPKIRWRDVFTES